MCCRKAEKEVVSSFTAKQNEVHDDGTAAEKERRSAVLDQRQRLKEGAITKKPAKKSRMRVQVAASVSPKKGAGKAGEGKGEEATKKKEDSGDECEGGGLLGLGDYGSDDDSE